MMTSAQPTSGPCIPRLRHFASSQDGASTVEFLVVAVAACGFGLLALNLVGAGVLELWGKVDEEFVAIEPEISGPGS